MIRNTLKVILSVVMVAAFAALTGCANTARERYKLDAPIVTGAWDVGQGLHLAKKIPEPVWTAKVEPTLNRAVKDVNDAHQWITDNPQLADVPYAPCPPLDDLRAILPDLINFRFAIFPVPLTPPPAPPATRPTTQP